MPGSLTYLMKSKTGMYACNLRDAVFQGGECYEATWQRNIDDATVLTRKEWKKVHFYGPVEFDLIPAIAVRRVFTLTDQEMQNG